MTHCPVGRRGPCERGTELAEALLHKRRKRAPTGFVGAAVTVDLGAAVIDDHGRGHGRGLIVLADRVAFVPEDRQGQLEIFDQSIPSGLFVIDAHHQYPQTGFRRGEGL